MDAQLGGGVREVSVGVGQRSLDEPPLEFPAAVLEANPALHHLIDETQQQFSHGRVYCKSRPVSRRNASRYFSRVRSTTSSGREGTGGCLFQRMDSR